MSGNGFETILVTGGAGFIGAHLARRLLETGRQVVVLDDLSSGKQDNVPPAATFIKGSVLDMEAVREALALVDACIHLAAVASVERCNQQLTSSHAVNITGFLNLVEAIANSGTKQPLVYASSAAVYGASQSLPLSEEGRCVPLSPYGADKFSCELHARAAYEVYGISTTGLRFFNVFGPGQDPRSPYSGVITKFAQRLSRDENIVIYGDGTQTRDFVYVEDVVEALIRSVERPPVGARVLNVCSGVETSINDLARIMIEETKSGCGIDYVDGLLGEVRRSQGCVRAFQEALDYRCRTDLRVGLAQLLAPDRR
ncbi:NAD-dependent epimerase/dehydratase family protein [Ensifer adhaerens]|uniref:NAD-dependent epimerase/dehydratase family protein n=1 Tax=Ensifer adhaerens TaxID=106592 RepID=UPI001CBD2FD9|nr:NAD-dependent epimerase/dehydratase family protein [Ensifer adhaerens]MBZ7925879.1 NAD-dependent epimerase/dehydratase family protein [Ensifer adhaerens]UAX94961.1 NAD-dependent epimerase/dehydratase family protein [Ensifer adhaerens]UAY03148.1 NAD-dependent epimerase/dehydratase family protein [Ensifer adhaerens]UAY11133.1 NAD-dependent epimerase/dehydratase family protein [Ensifer adhaerens]